MIAGSNDDDYDPPYLNFVEAVDLSDPNLVCDPIQSFPVGIYGLTAGWIDGSYIKACGGDNTDDDNESDCYDYHPENGVWTPGGRMILPRIDLRSSTIDGTFLVSGDNNEPSGNTTEVWNGSDFDMGIKLPEQMYFHCQLTLNETHVFFGGNYGGTYLLDWPNQEWITLPCFEAPWSPSCGLIQNADGGQEIVVSGDGETYIFSMQDLSWRDGPPLLPKFNFAASTQVGDTFVIVGGFDDFGDHLDTIYMFDNVNYDWILMEQRLDVARMSPAVVTVPRDFINCS